VLDCPEYLPEVKFMSFLLLTVGAIKVYVGQYRGY
jgi:hypothetical protein